MRDAKVLKSVKPILQVVWVWPALARALVAQFPSLEKSLAQWLNGLVNSRPELVNISNTPTRRPCLRPVPNVSSFFGYHLVALKRKTLIQPDSVTIFQHPCQSGSLFQYEFSVRHLGDETQPAWCFPAIWVSAFQDKPCSNSSPPWQ